MPPKIAKHFDQMDADLTSLLKVLNNYSEKTLNKKPAENKWSILQIMHHLILAEGYGQSYVKKKLSYNPELKKAGIMAFLRKSVAIHYLKSPFRIKAPEAVGDEYLPEYASFWETAKKWKQQREDLRILFESMPPDIFDKEVYNHPLAGRLTLEGLLAFYQSHFARHRKQIDKILKKSFKKD